MLNDRRERKTLKGTAKWMVRRAGDRALVLSLMTRGGQESMYKENSFGWEFKCRSSPRSWGTRIEDERKSEVPRDLE